MIKYLKSYFTLQKALYGIINLMFLNNLFQGEMLLFQDRISSVFIILFVMNYSTLNEFTMLRRKKKISNSNVDDFLQNCSI